MFWFVEDPLAVGNAAMCVGLVHLEARVNPSAPSLRDE